MENRTLVRVNAVKKALLAASAAALVLTPLAAGLLWSPAQAAACKIDPVVATHTLPPYPADSAKAGETGTVLLTVTIARDGHVSGAKVTHSSGFVRLDEAATSHVRQNYRWRPLGCASAQTPLKVVFNLAKEPIARMKGAQNDGPNVERINRTLPPPARP